MGKQSNGEEYSELLFLETVRQYEELVSDQFKLRNRSRVITFGILGFGLTLFNKIESINIETSKVFVLTACVVSLVLVVALYVSIEWPRTLGTEDFTHSKQVALIRAGQPILKSELDDMILKLHSETLAYRDALFVDHGKYEIMIVISLISIASIAIAIKMFGISI